MLLRVDPGDLNFGTVWEQKDFAVRLPVRNESKRQIAIEDIFSSCSCTDLTPRSFALQPGETRELLLKIDLTRNSPLGGEFERDIAIQILPTIRGETDQTDRSSGWLLRGRVRTAIHVLAAGKFGDHSEEEELIPSLKLPIQAVLPLRQLSATTTDTRFRVRVIQGGSNGYDIHIAPQARLPKGPFHCDVVVTAEPLNGLSAPPVKLRVEGQVVDDVQASPAAVDLGGAVVGSRLRETITLFSLTSSPFHVEQCVATQSTATILPVAGQARSYEIAFSCAEPGPHSSSIDIVIRDTKGMRKTLSIPVRYYGFIAGTKNI